MEASELIQKAGEEKAEKELQAKIKKADLICLRPKTKKG